MVIVTLGTVTKCGSCVVYHEMGTAFYWVALRIAVNKRIHSCGVQDDYGTVVAVADWA